MVADVGRVEAYGFAAAVGSAREVSDLDQQLAELHAGINEGWLRADRRAVALEGGNKVSLNSGSGGAPPSGSWGAGRAI
jgi:hypothetical protein